MQPLSKLLSKHFIRFSIVPILIIEVSLLLIYFLVNYYIGNQNLHALHDDAIKTSKVVLKNEASRIDATLKEVSMQAKMMQDNHQYIFKNLDNLKILTNPEFAKADNGVFYKTNKEGSSVYYSSKTIIDEKETQKAIQTEAMDPLLISLVDRNPNIIASYFNSYDDMNRLYPFIDKVYEQYGEHIHMEDYNFYFLADQKHNPSKLPAWTEAYLDPAGNSWMVSCVVPIYNGDKLEGVSGLDITIEALTKNLLNKELPYDTKIFLVDTKGTILAMPQSIEKLLGIKELKKHQYTEAILDTVEKPKEFNLLTNENKFAKHFKDMIVNNLDASRIEDKENSYITLKQTIPETKWNLMLVVDENKVFEATYNLNKLYTNIGILLIVFMILFYIIYFYILKKKSKVLSTQISQPLINLANETSRVGTNDERAIHIETDIKEIEQLYANFAKMVLELDDRTKTLLRQSKSAAMGEMMDAVAHQWKQPLSAISMIASDIELQSIMQDSYPKKDLDKATKTIKNKISHLIETVDEFRKFFRPNTPKTNVNISTLIHSVIEFEFDSIKNNNVNITVEEKDICKYNLIETEFKHVFINMINNSIYAFNDYNINPRYIQITLEKTSKEIVITILDNAGGVPQEIIEDIFRANKTTKGDKGTGIGLYLATQIVDKLDGTITVSNKKWTNNDETYTGAEFIIKLPL